MKRGFTLIEILIVVIIIGILATIAIPQLTNIVERSRRAEALTHMAAFQTALRVYQLEENEFPDDLNLLDMEMPNARDWTYEVRNAGVDAFELVAIRDGGDAAVNGTEMIINQDGLFTAGSDYPYTPSN